MTANADTGVPADASGVRAYAWVALALAGLLALTLAGLGRDEANRREAARLRLAAAQVQQGAALFGEHCAVCHGPEALGGLGPALAGPNSVATAPDAALFALIRAGVPGSAMPAWSVDLGGPLTDEAVRSVIAHLRAQPSQTASDSAVLSADEARGAQLFGAVCATCHGPNGEGGEGPALNDPAWLAKTPDEVLFAIVRYGKPGTTMAAHSADLGGLLAEADIRQVIAHLRGWAIPVSAATDEAPEAERGALMFIANCAECHGLHGEGTERAPALNERAFLNHTPNEQIFSIIFNGVPLTNMAAWGKTFGGPFTHADIRHLVAFIRGWEPNAPLLIANDPDPARGALIFATHCAACHGPDGQGGSAVRLNDPERLRLAGAAYFRQAIVNGRPSRRMPTWGTVLAPEQVEDLVALAVAWREGVSVTVEYAVPDLLDAAVFALDHGDRASATMHLDRALAAAATGLGWERLAELQTQLKRGDLAGARQGLWDLRSVWPLGDPALGYPLFLAHCARCHGQRGEGGLAPDLRGSPTVGGRMNTDLLDVILNGRPGTEMHAFKIELAETDVAQIVALLRTWQPYVEPPQGRNWQPPQIRTLSDMSGNCANCHSGVGKPREDKPPDDQ